ncbi:MAG: rhomboid family intramembrane serine protease [Bacteroidia bacterium]
MGWYGQFLKRFGFVGVLLSLLSLVYVALFLAYGLLGPDRFDFFYQQVTLPVNLRAAIDQPWSVFTYWLVSHPLSFWFLLGDLVVLYAFGHILNAMLGDRRTQAIVTIAVLTNGLLAIGLANILPTVEYTPVTRLAGFGAINATLIAATITLVPRYNFRIIFWDVQLLYIGLFLLLLSVVSYRAIFTVQGTATIIGAGVGWFIIKVLRSGWNVTRWFQGAANRPQQSIPRQPEPVLTGQRPVIRNINPKAKTVAPQPQQPELTEAEELDMLLDKINEVGYSGLSQQEKERLDKLSAK